MGIVAPLTGQRAVGFAWWLRHRGVGDAFGVAGSALLLLAAVMVGQGIGPGSGWRLGLTGLLVVCAVVLAAGWRAARRDWAQRAVSSRTLFPAERRVRSGCGIMVRSSGEAAIADQLTAARVRFAYERRRVAWDGSSRVPDFTLWDAWGREWYLEHLGMLDKAEYRQRCQSQVLWYDWHFPGRLLVTMPGDLDTQVARILDALQVSAAPS